VVIPVLFGVMLGSACVLIVYMITHGEDDIVQAVEHEVVDIRRQAGRGWTARRILRHHRNFCTCQVEYLTRHTYRQV
jgi:hypothetical protein